MRKTSAWIASCTAIFCLLVIAPSAIPQAAGNAPAAGNPLGLKPDHITASVLDVDRAARWYQDVLGFKLVSRSERPGFKSADLEIPGFGLGLVQTNQTAITPPPGTTVRPSWLHIVFSVADPDKLYDVLQQRGASITTHSGTITRPLKTFLIHDSEGNEIEIVQAGAS